MKDHKALTLNIPFVKAWGSIRIVPISDPQKTNPPQLAGQLKLEGEKVGGRQRTVQLDIAGWQRSGDKGNYYSFSVGGIPATLFPNVDKQAHTDPDYTGAFGFDWEFKFAGWKKTDGNSQWISVTVSEKQQRSETQPVKGQSRVHEAPSQPVDATPLHYLD